MDEMEVECPVEGCGYTGTARSVEGHISGSTRGEHQGQAGSNYRPEIEAAVEAVEEGATEQTTEAKDGDGSPVTLAPAAGAAGVGGLSLASGEIDKRMVALAAVAILVVILLLASGGEEPAGEEIEESQPGQPEGDEAFAFGGE